MRMREVNFMESTDFNNSDLGAEIDKISRDTLIKQLNGIDPKLLSKDDMSRIIDECVNEICYNVKRN